MNLNELKIGKDAVVASVDCDEPSRCASTFWTWVSRRAWRSRS